MAERKAADLKSEGRATSYFPRLDAVIAAVEAEFTPWAGRNETLRRLCAIT